MYKTRGGFIVSWYIVRLYEIILFYNYNLVIREVWLSFILLLFHYMQMKSFINYFNLVLFFKLQPKEKKKIFEG